MRSYTWIGYDKRAQQSTQHKRVVEITALYNILLLNIWYRWSVRREMEICPTHLLSVNGLSDQIIHSSWNDKFLCVFPEHREGQRFIIYRIIKKVTVVAGTKNMPDGESSPLLSISHIFDPNSSVFYCKRWIEDVLLFNWSLPAWSGFCVFCNIAMS